MSDVVMADQRRRIEELTTQVAELRKAGRVDEKRRIKLHELTGEVEALKGQLASVTTERDQLKSRVETAPGEHAARIADLEAQIRRRDHRDAFAGVKSFKAKTRGEDGAEAEHEYQLRPGVTPEALWRNIDYTPDGDTPDVARIQGLMGAAVSTHGYLFEPTGGSPATGAGAPANGHGAGAPGNGAGAPGAGVRTPATRPGPGASRSNDQTRLTAVEQINASFGTGNPGRIA